MSGICALWGRASGPAVSGLGARMLGALKLDVTERPNVIEDLAGPILAGVSARFDTQQSYAHDDVIVVCDAEFYNEAELQRSVDFKSIDRGLDTAALLRELYRRYDLDLFDRLRGKFSFAIWDGRAKRMIAAIDRFGIGRLAWCESRRTVAVASRVDALGASGLIDGDIDPVAVANVLNFSANLEPVTIFRGVQRLPAGCFRSLPKAT